MTHPKREAVRSVLAAVEAPDWAAPNLDGLADVLRDLSWLPDGPVEIAVPELTALDPADRQALLGVLERAAAESGDSPHPLRIRR
jgi:hypothetical protein